MFEKRADIVVAGGGIAGVSAAISAAKNGSKVILIEKNIWLGGLATCGLIDVYEPLCDGNGHQVTFGLAEELLKRSLFYGPGNIPENWQNARNAPRRERLHCTFSPASMVLALDEMLEECGVELWLDTLIIGTESEENKLKSVTVANKSGIGKISAEVFIDASGDADLAFMSGDEVHLGGNKLASWAIECNDGEEKNPLTGNIHTAMLGTAAEKIAVYPPGIDGKTVTEFTLAGRKRYREMLKKDYADGVKDRFSRYPLLVPVMAEFRTTRCFKGRFALDEGMQWQRFDDSIGLAADWRKPGFVWEIPYRTLLSEKFDNLLAAGRCSASRGDAWEITRVIPIAAMTGEVAGLSGAMALDKNTTPAELPYADLSKKLTSKCNFVLHFEDLGLSGE